MFMNRRWFQSCWFCPFKKLMLSFAIQKSYSSCCWSKKSYPQVVKTPLTRQLSLINSWLISCLEKSSDKFPYRAAAEGKKPFCTTPQQQNFKTLAWYFRSLCVTKILGKGARRPLLCSLGYVCTGTGGQRKEGERGRRMRHAIYWRPQKNLCWISFHVT